jgi:hypothetical protein
LLFQIQIVPLRRGCQHADGRVEEKGRIRGDARRKRRRRKRRRRRRRRRKRRRRRSATEPIFVL